MKEIERTEAKPNKGNGSITNISNKNTKYITEKEYNELNRRLDSVEKILYDVTSLLSDTILQLPLDKGGE